MTINYSLKTTDVLKYFIYHPKAKELRGRDQTIARIASLSLSGVTLGIAPLVCRVLWKDSDAAKNVRRSAIRARIQTAPKPTLPYPTGFGEPYVKILGSKETGKLFLGPIHGLALASSNRLKSATTLASVPSNNPENITHVISLCPIAEMRCTPFRWLKSAERSVIVNFLHFPDSIHVHPLGEIIPDQGARGDLISTLLLYTHSLTGKSTLLPKQLDAMVNILKYNLSLKGWCQKTLDGWEKNRDLFSPFFGNTPECFETYFHQHLSEIEEEAALAFQNTFDHSGWALLVHACSEKTLPEGIPVREVPFHDHLIWKAQQTLITTPVEEWFEPAFKIVDQAVFGKANVLVHCQAGKSRSPAFLAAYLINRFDVTADEALNFLAERRPEVNSRFLYELREYAAQLKAIRSS